MLIDTHVHLNMEPLLSDWQNLVDKALKSGVSAMIIPGSNEVDSKMAISLAEQHENLYAAVGIHPEEVTAESDHTKALEIIQTVSQDKQVVGIGEVGLDYSYLGNNSSAELIINKQRTLLANQLEIARDKRLPVILHTREKQSFMDTTEEISRVYGSHDFLGVFHCFSHAVEEIHMIQKLGGHIGVGGLITFKQNDLLRSAIRQTPLSMVVLETDAPYLSPEPLRGKTNTPSNVTITAVKLAEVLDVPLSQIIEQTGKAACQLFSLPHIGA